MCVWCISLGLVVTFVVGMIVVVVVFEVVQVVILCSMASSGKVVFFYVGLLVLYVYDKCFLVLVSVLGLDMYISQGVVAWCNWDGVGYDIFLVMVYCFGVWVWVYGINLVNGVCI